VPSLIFREPAAVLLARDGAAQELQPARGDAFADGDLIPLSAKARAGQPLLDLLHLRLLLLFDIQTADAASNEHPTAKQASPHPTVVPVQRSPKLLSKSSVSTGARYPPSRRPVSLRSGGARENGVPPPMTPRRTCKHVALLKRASARGIPHSAARPCLRESPAVPSASNSRILERICWPAALLRPPAERHVRCTYSFRLLPDNETFPRLISLCASLAQPDNRISDKSLGQLCESLFYRVMEQSSGHIGEYCSFVGCEHEPWY
jgi:hypothetical protein